MTAQAGAAETGPGPAADPVRIGVLGCASIARRRMLPAFRASAAIRLAAVASRDRERAEATAAEFGCRGVHGYGELLARDEIEAVYLPLPAALIAPWAERALRAGKHVLAEKPLTTDPGTAVRLFGLADAAGLVLTENVMFLQHSQHAAVRGLLTGPPLSFSAAFCIPARPAGDIRLSAALDGGALTDAGFYPLRAAVQFLGGVELAGVVLRRPPGSEVDLSGDILLRTPQGLGAHLSFGFGMPYRSTYEIADTHQRYSVTHAFTPPADHCPVVRRSDAPDLVLPADDQVGNAVQAFADAVRQRRPNAPAAIIRTAQLIAGARAAAVRSGFAGLQ